MQKVCFVHLLYQYFNAGICQCNLLGAYGRTCEPNPSHCTCKPGYGGLRCNRCEPNFWGLPNIADGNSDCIRELLLSNINISRINTLAKNSDGTSLFS